MEDRGIILFRHEDTWKPGITDYSSEWKKNMCPKCINSDGDCHCITKEEAPFGTFICENGEMFEPLVGE